MSREAPWLSVIMPTYNGARYLQPALESIAVQNDPRIEIIVVDDGSTDPTMAIVDAFKPRLPIQSVRRHHTGNWITATNTGLSVASGAYVSILHQDDIWLPDRLKHIRRLIAIFPDIHLFVFPSVFIDKDGRRIGTWKCPLPHTRGPLSPDSVLPGLLIQNYIAAAAPCFRRDAADRAGGLDETLWYTADWKFWIHLAAQGPLVYHPRMLTAFRLHDASHSLSASANPLRFRAQMQSVVDQCLPLACSKEGSAKVRQLAGLSIAVNTFLAAIIRNGVIDFRSLTGQGLIFNPLAGYHYFRYSRIIERVMARIRAGLTGNRSVNRCTRKQRGRDAVYAHGMPANNSGANAAG